MSATRCVDVQDLQLRPAVPPQRAAARALLPVPSAHVLAFLLHSPPLQSLLRAPASALGAGTFNLSASDSAYAFSFASPADAFQTFAIFLLAFESEASIYSLLTQPLSETLLVTGQDQGRVRAFLQENENRGSLISLQEYDALIGMLQSFFENQPIGKDVGAALLLLNQGRVLALTDEEVEATICDESVITMLQYYFGRGTRDVIEFYYHIKQLLI